MMRAVRMLGGERVEVIDAPAPAPPEGGVVVRVRASGLCGSEMHSYRAAEAMDQPPNGGHEPAGEVVDATRSRRWHVGDRVGIHAVWGCGHCNWCAQGIYTFCDQISVGVGAHAELFAAPDHVLAPLPDDVDYPVGALLAGDGLGVPYHTSQRLKTRGGDTVAVVGCGPIGLGNILVQSFLGARVVGLDLVPRRLDWARELGAAATLDAGEGPAEALREITAGRMADAVIEASGRPEGFALALRLVGKGGTVACCGENRDVALHVGRDLIRRDITLFGGWFYHYRDYPRMLELRRRGLAVERLISHQFALEQAADAFALFAAGQTAKVVLTP
jgi:threonine dehydrogenase-like Zn-dependent dehydrogenase